MAASNVVTSAPKQSNTAVTATSPQAIKCGQLITVMEPLMSSGSGRPSH